MAQLSGSVALTSDYRMFGVSLTDRRPAVTLAASYDHPSGLYAGGSVTAQDPEGGGGRLLGHTEYVGFALRRPDGVSLDVGVNNIDLKTYWDRRYTFEYNQIYFGVSKDDFDAHVYVSPNYPRKGRSAAYVDLSGAVRPADNWRLTAHGGMLMALGEASLQDGRRARYDLRLGATRQFPNCELSLAWATVFPRPRARTSWTRSGFIAGATYFF